ncbi:hypothetical protein EMPS_06849 [Entomortierella parvispora]|uniref:Major facilitator superfamily (MFS) profile domain-containing protein n=1 Tax=Entomortierella parvispora TaxID=205924 RepID=A0A9P3HDA5_9FUNG|nr:hypothetical protein EMPS_06849 [Entomortierella parvispora]
MTTITPSSENEKQEAIPQSTETHPDKESISPGEQKAISATSTLVEPDVLKDFPEGGFGWLVVLASFVIYFWTFGLNSTFGVFQAHFLRVGAFNHATEADLSWVGSLAAGVVFLPGPFINTLIRHLGLYTLVIVGTLSCSLGFILASFATQLWQLYLTQGLLFGLGGGMVFLSTISMTSQYFNKRRGFANGIVVSGSGLGGLVLAPLTNLLISKMGVQWCQRILGFCMLACLVAIFPFLRPRVKTVKTVSIVDWSLFKVKGFGWLWAFSLVMPFGYMIPVFLTPTYSSFILGQSSATGAQLISIFAGVNAAARIGMGFVSDHVGRVNTLFVCCFMAGMASLAIWSVATSITILTVFMVVFGAFGGGFISMVPVVTAQVVGVERLTAALGILYFGQMIGNLFGAPIATAIMKVQHGQYLGAILFAGLAPLVASFFVLVIRFQMNKKVFAFV